MPQVHHPCNVVPKSVFTGDCLPIVRGINTGCIDLIYLDPPFNSKADYAAPIGSVAAGAAFKDTWTLTDIDIAWVDLIETRYPRVHRVINAALSNSDKAYLIYIAVRLLELHRVLKDTGSLYLHCDPTMSHYLKLLLDALFGPDKFRNEIVWHYTGGGRSKSYFSRKHDILFWYARGKACTFNIDAVRVPYKNTSGYAQGGIVAKSGKHYTPNPAGTPVDDVWDMPIINPMNKTERTGYPTQKPLALLERIIRASSNAGDMVLDPFCGCATTCVAADRLGRDWIGIDLSNQASALVQRRIKDDQGMFQSIIHRTDIPERSDLGKVPPANSLANKTYLYGQQGGYCNGCGTHFEIQHLDVDHIIARAQGGTDHIDNLQLLCGHCNRTKGTRGPEYLLAKINANNAPHRKL